MSVSTVPGTQYRQVQTPTRSPQQMQLIQQLMSALSPGLTEGVGRLGEMAGGGTPEMWAQLEAPAMRQFGALQGNIASRFSGMGGSGARHSSGFQNEMGGASADLAERLQSNRLGLQNQAMQQLMSLGTNLIGQDLFDTHFMPKKQSFGKEFLMSVLPSLVQGGANFGSLTGLMKMFGGM